MRKTAKCVVAILIAVLVLVVLRARSLDRAEAKARADWKSRAEQAGCLVKDGRDPARPSLMRQILWEVADIPAQELRLQLFVPDQASAERILPMLTERSDILVIDHHLEDVSAAMLERMKTATPKTHFRGYNPFPGIDLKFGRHIPGKDWNGVTVADATIPGQNPE